MATLKCEFGRCIFNKAKTMETSKSDDFDKMNPLHKVGIIATAGCVIFLMFFAIMFVVNLLFNI